MFNRLDAEMPIAANVVAPMLDGLPLPTTNSPYEQAFRQTLTKSKLVPNTYKHERDIPKGTGGMWSSINGGRFMQEGDLHSLAASGDGEAAARILSRAREDAQRQADFAVQRAGLPGFTVNDPSISPAQAFQMAMQRAAKEQEIRDNYIRQRMGDMEKALNLPVAIDANNVSRERNAVAEWQAKVGSREDRDKDLALEELKQQGQNVRDDNQFKIMKTQAYLQEIKQFVAENGRQPTPEESRAIINKYSAAAGMTDRQSQPPILNDRRRQSMGLAPLPQPPIVQVLGPEGEQGGPAASTTPEDAVVKASKEEAALKKRRMILERALGISVDPVTKMPTKPVFDPIKASSELEKLPTDERTAMVDAIVDRAMADNAIGPEEQEKMIRTIINRANAAGINRAGPYGITFKPAHWLNFGLRDEYSLKNMVDGGEFSGGTATNKAGQTVRMGAGGAGAIAALIAATKMAPALAAGGAVSQTPLAAILPSTKLGTIATGGTGLLTGANMRGDETIDLLPTYNAAAVAKAKSEAEMTAAILAAYAKRKYGKKEESAR